VKPGVVRFLHAHERVQVAQLLGIERPGMAAQPTCYGWVYESAGDAERMAAANRANGHTVYGPTTWEEQPVSLLVPSPNQPPQPWWRTGAEQRSE